MEILQLKSKISKTIQSELRKKRNQKKNPPRIFMSFKSQKEKSEVLKKYWNNAENFLNLVKDINLQIQEAEWILIG